MSNTEVIIAVAGLMIPIIMALLLLVHKMHNGRVDTLDKREAENNRIHLQNYRAMQASINEERKANEERATRIYDRLDKVTEHLGELATNIAGNFITKEDCSRCKEK